MVFSSLIFLFFFLPAVLFCYYIVPTRFIRARNMVLLLFSLFFYFYGEPKLIIMLVLSILMNYLFGLSMRSRYRKSLLIFCITANLTLLGVFKYLNFFIRTADGLLGLNIQLTSIVMPIGISFYTFQALSYVIDVYRREVPPQHDPFSLALYVSMFPQLIAGPIVRYHDVNEQLAVRSHSVAQFSDGISRFVFGLSKRFCCPMCSHRLQTEFSPTSLPSCPQRRLGSVQSAIRCRFTSIFPAIRIWQSVWAKCSALPSSKTSITHISAVRSRSFGADGTFRCPLGSAIMFISRWVAIGVLRHGTSATCLSCGR